MYKGFVYIITNANRTVLYTGVTSDLYHRIRQHRVHEFAGFSARYGLTELIYYEEHPSIESAIVREKQIKSWSRQRKIDLIEELNPAWCNLLDDEDL